MVPGRPGTHKRVSNLAAHDHIHGLDIGTSCQTSGSKGVGHHGRVRVGKHAAAGRLHQVQLMEIFFRMHHQKLITGDFFRPHPVQLLVQASISKVADDGRQPLKAWRGA